MAKIPLEDSFSDIIGKAQRGLKISDEELAKLAEVSVSDLRRIKKGEVDDVVIRRVSRHLKLNPNLVEELAHKKWYPDQATFPHGFAMFNTVHEDMTVNSYVIWDGRSRDAAIFDTGADATDLLALVSAERLRVNHVFLTHAHDDHVAALEPIVAATKAQVWISENEPFSFPGIKTFKENVHFHIGSLAIKAIGTPGHSPGQTTFYVTGLSWPVAFVGDSLFAASMGGSVEHYQLQHTNDEQKILSLPKDTVIAPGHGPLTTVGQEKRHNAFFSR
jgi:glyoxylase-like metal-dependent hydrolase (beta-lactamase superfamily II)